MRWLYPGAAGKWYRIPPFGRENIDARGTAHSVSRSAPFGGRLKKVGGKLGPAAETRSWYNWQENI